MIVLIDDIFVVCGGKCICTDDKASLGRGAQDEKRNQSADGDCSRTNAADDDDR